MTIIRSCPCFLLVVWHTKPIRRDFDRSSMFSKIFSFMFSSPFKRSSCTVVLGCSCSRTGDRPFVCIPLFDGPSCLSRASTFPTTVKGSSCTREFTFCIRGRVSNLLSSHIIMAVEIFHAPIVPPIRCLD